MITDFKTKINKDLVKTLESSDQLLSDETMNEAIDMVRIILTMFEKNDFTVYESLVFLSSLSEAIYCEAINEFEI